MPKQIVKPRRLLPLVQCLRGPKFVFIGSCRWKAIILALNYNHIPTMSMVAIGDSNLHYSRIKVKQKNKKQLEPIMTTNLMVLASSLENTNTTHLVYTQAFRRSSFRPHCHGALSYTNTTQNGASWYLPGIQPAIKEDITMKYRKQCNYNIGSSSPNNI